MRQTDDDDYATYYADKLWHLLPAIYHAQDTESFDRAGPLRELINRIATQAAILRRSIDRLWEDQSIETCDDWVIPYIGELLATRLVASLGAREQRLDVAKTIYYRRRAGTVAILEEIARDITGWEAKTVEFFRQLGRTRHLLDPPVGLPDSLQTRYLAEAQGLIGSLTHTPMGGWADLRDRYGASKTHSAFDEYSYTVDSRRGIGQVGWHNIPKLGIFLWRLYSFGVGIPPNRDDPSALPVGVTPVPYQGKPEHYTFDPTGREIPLFAANACPFGDRWVSSEEWQLPTPISRQLLAAHLQNLYAETLGSEVLYNSLGIFDPSGNLFPVTQIAESPTNWQDPPTRLAQLGFWLKWSQILPADPSLPSQAATQWRISLANYLLSCKAFWVDPERGRLIKASNVPETIFVTYHYGFSTTLGAGPFDRRLLREPSLVPAYPPIYPNVTGGQEALTTERTIEPRTGTQSPLVDVIPTGTLTIADSRTYTTVSDLDDIKKVTLRSGNKTRPLIRLQPDDQGNLTEWKFTAADRDDGDDNHRALVLDGLFLSGVDVVLCGVFDTVTLTNCTFDPGQADDSVLPKSLYATSADGVELRPCHIWVEGAVKEFRIMHCILGPIRTRHQGTIDRLIVIDSIIQAIRTHDLGFSNPRLLALKLRQPIDPISTFIAASLSEATQQSLGAYDGIAPPSLQLREALRSDLNALLETPLYDNQRFSRIQLNPVTQRFLTQATEAENFMQLNQSLLKDAYPLELADTAVTMHCGETVLSRCTLLGPVSLHRLRASECILNDRVYVNDQQQGCVRFSAWATGSTLPVQRYESVEIAPGAPLFKSRIFGQPSYAQLRSDVDRAILAGEPGATIAAGAEDGSEMGAFAREKGPIKARSLRLKYEEYMPLGLTPVMIYAT